jgi:hypothetical protein
MPAALQVEFGLDVSISEPTIPISVSVFPDDPAAEASVKDIAVDSQSAGLGLDVSLSEVTIPVSLSPVKDRRTTVPTREELPASSSDIKAADSPLASTMAGDSQSHFTVTAFSMAGGLETEPVDDSQSRKLLGEAAVAADRQALCRDTMINLKEAFEGALSAQQELQERQRLEQQRVAQLREERFHLMEALREMEEKVEASEKKIAELTLSHQALQQELKEVRGQQENDAARLASEQSDAMKQLLVEREEAKRLAAQAEEERAKLLEQLAQGRRQTALFKNSLLELQDRDKEEELRRQKLESEKQSLQKQLEDSARQHELERHEFQEQLLRARRDAEEKESLMQEMHQKLEAKEDALRRAEASWENEKRALQGNLRDVTSSLQQALSQARHMESALKKAKRTGAEALLERLSAMVADLEAAKAKLSRVTKERDKAVDSNAWLNGQLSNKTRQGELDRQFLPLIRATRGPVGQKTLMSKTLSASEGKLQMLR